VAAVDWIPGGARSPAGLYFERLDSYDNWVFAQQLDSVAQSWRLMTPWWTPQYDLYTGGDQAQAQDRSLGYGSGDWSASLTHTQSPWTGGMYTYSYQDQYYTCPRSGAYLVTVSCRAEIDSATRVSSYGGVVLGGTSDTHVDLFLNGVALSVPVASVHSSTNENYTYGDRGEISVLLDLDINDTLSLYAYTEDAIKGDYPVFSHMHMCAQLLKGE